MCMPTFAEFMGEVTPVQPPCKYAPNLKHTYLFGEIASWSYGLIANAYRQNKAIITRVMHTYCSKQFYVLKHTHSGYVS